MPTPKTFAVEWNIGFLTAIARKFGASEDERQELLLHVWRKRLRFDPTRGIKPTSWAYRVMRNRLATIRKRDLLPRPRRVDAVPVDPERLYTIAQCVESQAESDRLVKFARGMRRRHWVKLSELRPWLNPKIRARVLAIAAARGLI